MVNRTIDYYIKNLDMGVRQKIFTMLRDVNPTMVQKMLEKNEGYPSLKRIGLKDDNIAEMLSESAMKFSAINKYMMDNKRPPLFVKPSDTYASSKQYVELLKEKTEEELNEEFGCSWEDYVPETYQKEESNDAPDLE